MRRMLRERRSIARATTAAILLATGVVMVPGVAASRPLPPDPDGGGPVSTPSDEIDLADFPADRWIVQLDEPAVAETAGAGRLDMAAPENVVRRDELRGRQAEFESRLEAAVPGAETERAYQVVLNGLAVDMSRRAGGRRAPAARRPGGDARRRRTS